MAQPVLLKFALPREKELLLLGKYDNSLDMWLDVSGKPLINTSLELPELRTKTDVIRERDDASNYNMLELMTKTKIDRESDDR